MMKYPQVYTVKEFERVISQVPELLDLQGYIEPKYDGSNITVFDGVFRTRNLNPLPQQFINGLHSALGGRLAVLKKLSHKYQVFLELGGYRNAPAGYSEGWEDKWDYRVFDMAVGSTFIKPEKVEEICRENGLKFVGFRVLRVEDAFREWRKILQNYDKVEGFVLKIFPDQELLRRIRNHRQYNTVLAKFKHEYTGVKVKPVKEKKKKEKKTVEEEKEMMPVSEIMGAINKAHLELGDNIFDKKKAMPLIFKKVKEEAEKHGYAIPKASTLFRMYQNYIEKLK